MKITAYFHAIQQNNYTILREINANDGKLLRLLFKNKIEREARCGHEILLECTLDAPLQKRSYKQLRTVWKLVTIIFESMEGRKPTDTEKQELYLDLLDVYADRVPNRLHTDKTRPVHLSEANTLSAAHFIDALLNHIASECGLSFDLQSEVRGILFEWERWRGEADAGFLDGVKASDWHPIYSEASGLAGGVDKHHILSRGAYPQYRDCTWNLLALTREEHEFFHAHGEKTFITKYPHLQGRIERAHNKAAGSM